MLEDVVERSPSGHSKDLPQSLSMTRRTNATTHRLCSIFYPCYLSDKGFAERKNSEDVVELSRQHDDHQTRLESLRELRWPTLIQFIGENTNDEVSCFYSALYTDSMKNKDNKRIDSTEEILYS
ncbi:hypothetical protein HZH68_003246 [Vespula germanica]|uniref:Uncharacterized protein n=1 Tax=Vespula germanica TaxID=30212 RepID=A0A834NNV9_VESGE|nr:hypothetical protein HZH68_003246 [Vespula germanica]